MEDELKITFFVGRRYGKLTIPKCRIGSRYVVEIFS